MSMKRFGAGAAALTAALLIGSTSYSVAADEAVAISGDIAKVSIHEDAGFVRFKMFGYEAGEAKFLVNDDKLGMYVGVFRSNQPFPADNKWELNVNEYLTVVEGAIKVDFLNNGRTITIQAGEMAYLPAGSVLRLTLLKLPYAESFVMMVPKS